MQTIKILILSTIILCQVLYAATPAPPNQIKVLSLSSDGNYAISTNTNQEAILWDIKNKNYKIIANHVNIYSAYFIKNTDDFIYQSNTTNEVIVENIKEQIVKKLNPQFPTYGEVMTSDLKTWIGSDAQYQLFKITDDNQKQQFFYYWDGPNFVHETPPPKDMPYGSQDFQGAGKLFNLSLSADDKILLSSGVDGFYLWDIQSTKIIENITKNIGKSFAIFSPDNQSIISGDEEFYAYIHDINQKLGTLLRFDAPANSDIQAYLDNINASYNSHINKVGVAVLSIKYIDQNYFLVFVKTNITNPFSFGILYTVSNRGYNKVWREILLPTKYLKLANEIYYPQSTPPEFPALMDYSRDMAIDTSPSAHILAIAMNNANGILVYKYDPATQTLTQIWAPVIKSSIWNFF